MDSTVSHDSTRGRSSAASVSRGRDTHRPTTETMLGRHQYCPSKKNRRLDKGIPVKSCITMNAGSK